MAQMIDHAGVRVSDFVKARAFYRAAGPLARGARR
jgi:catechol 2,3-dioxygenase-like lactoylglutathione lyase family enzyme